MHYYWFPTPKELVAAGIVETEAFAANDVYASLSTRNIAMARRLATDILAALAEENVPLATEWFAEGLALMQAVTAQYMETRDKQRLYHAQTERMGIVKMLYAS